MQRGKLVILSGPSGVGKDTVIDRWKKANDLVERVVAYTTRDPRPGEVADVDYHFVSREEFLGMADRGEFLEFKEVYGNFYATPLLDMERMLDEGKIAILKIDVQGALTAMNLRDDAITVFLMPPDAEELVRRIRDRATEHGDVLERRIENAKAEIALADHYRYHVVNDDVDRAVGTLEEIVGG
jgi:guanylate kinase